ncbi:MAG: class I SAM-dependent methyltransferase [Pseudomonadota bacterium]|nr:class I SAM-dependent methyltransferase [Pseudomonadota bacterium]
MVELVNGINRAAAGKKHINIVEVGVARGMTTRFICQYIVSSNLLCTYFCIDTFSGFTETDVNYEVQNRGKNRSDFFGFRYNDYDRFRKNFKEFDFVKPVMIDAARFDFSKIGTIDFLFLDVDLYKPTKAVLNSCKPFLGANAVVIVDDVLENQWCDGAHDAFMSFVDENGLTHRVVGNKCGIIEF